MHSNAPYIITWTRLHNGFMKATDNRFVTGFSVSFYSVVNPFVFSAELGKEKSLPCIINFAAKKSYRRYETNAMWFCE